MARKRLSKIQKAVLELMAPRRTEWIYYGEIKWAVARSHGRLTHEPQYYVRKMASAAALASGKENKPERSSDSRICDSFLSSFSRSMAGLESKGLIASEEVHVIFDLDLWEFCRFWAYHTNSLRTVSRREPIIQQVTREQDVPKMKRAKIFFEGIDSLSGSYHKRYRITGNGVAATR